MFHLILATTVFQNRFSCSKRQPRNRISVAFPVEPGAAVSPKSNVGFFKKNVSVITIRDHCPPPTLYKLACLMGQVPQLVSLVVACDFRACYPSRVRIARKRRKAIRKRDMLLCITSAARRIRKALRAKHKCCRQYHECRKFGGPPVGIRQPVPTTRRSNNTQGYATNDENSRGSG